VTKRGTRAHLPLKVVDERPHEHAEQVVRRIGVRNEDVKALAYVPRLCGRIGVYLRRAELRKPVPEIPDSRLFILTSKRRFVPV